MVQAGYLITDGGFLEVKGFSVVDLIELLVILNYLEVQFLAQRLEVLPILSDGLVLALLLDCCEELDVHNVGLAFFGRVSHLI